MKLHIKNMVCDRCKMVVGSVLENFGLHTVSIELGEVHIVEQPGNEVLDNLNIELRQNGFELIIERKSQVIEKIKNRIIELVHSKNNYLQTNLSNYLATSLAQDYSALSNLFSQHENVTIEQYYILQKVERIKELLHDGELNLNEIADSLHYSSASHLTKQFKKVTGLAPTAYKNRHAKNRKPLDSL